MSSPKPKTSTVERLRQDPKVEFADDERGNGNGIIITLRQGWTFSAGQDNRVRGEDTPAKAREMIRHDAKAFAGPYED